jgi:hypothetical protein
MNGNPSEVPLSPMIPDDDPTRSAAFARPDDNHGRAPGRAIVRWLPALTNGGY